MHKPFYPTAAQIIAAQGKQLTALRVPIKPQPEGQYEGMCHVSSNPDHEDCAIFKAGEETRYIKTPYLPGEVLYFKEPWWKLGVRHPNIIMPLERARFFFLIEDIVAQRLLDHTIQQMSTEGYESYGEYRNDWDSRRQGDLRYANNPWTWYITGKIIPRPEGWPHG